MTDKETVETELIKMNDELKLKQKEYSNNLEKIIGLMEESSQNYTNLLIENIKLKHKNCAYNLFFLDIKMVISTKDYSRLEEIIKSMEKLQ